MKCLKYAILVFISSVFSAPSHHHHCLSKVKSEKALPNVQKSTSDFEGTVTAYTHNDCSGAPDGLWASTLTTVNQPIGCLSLAIPNSESPPKQILSVGANPFSWEGTTNYLIHFYSNGNCSDLVAQVNDTGIDCLDTYVYQQAVWSFDISTA